MASAVPPAGAWGLAVSRHHPPGVSPAQVKRWLSFQLVPLLHCKPALRPLSGQAQHGLTDLPASQQAGERCLNVPHHVSFSLQQPLQGAAVPRAASVLRAVIRPASGQAA